MNRRDIITELIVFLFVLLFLYAAGSKLVDFDRFIVQLSQSPFLTKFPKLIAWIIPSLEICLAAMLLIPRFRLLGFYGAFGLMMVFTTYISLMFIYAPKLPCSCGGVLALLGWKGHLILNIVFVCLAVIGIIQANKITQETPTGRSRYFFGLTKMNIFPFAGVTAFSILINLSLYATSDSFRNGRSFTRKLNSDAIHLLKAVAIDDNLYFAGLTKSAIFFGNGKNPLDLMVTDTLFSDFKPIRIRIEDEKEYPFESPRLQIDSPFFFVFDGKLPGVFKGMTGQWHASRVLEHTPYFLQAVRVSDDNVIITAVVARQGSGSNQNIIGKVSGTPSSLVWNDQLLIGEIDSLYSTRGNLRFSKSLNELVYVYTYTNDYIVLDTNLNLIFRANTIDPITRPSIKPVKIKEGVFANATPEVIVNKSSQVSGKLLFVNSSIMAVNEATEDFDQSSVIDVYDLEKRQYQYSFYIPDYDNTKLSTFRLLGNKLLARYPGHIVLYKLDHLVQ